MGIASGTPPSFSSAGPAVIGREPEVAAVREALAGARLGRSSRLLILGESGIGKSAILELARAEAQSMRLLAARGVEFEADMPFAGLHELLGPALGSLDRLPALHATALRSALGLGARTEADRLIIGAATLGLLSAYAEESPLLITIDDAQWLDRASAEAVGFAVRRLLADPIAVLVAIREGEDSPLLAAGFSEIRLAGLDVVSARALLGGPEPIPDEQLQHLVTATGGNPLAMLELRREAARLSGQPLESLPVATTVERSYLRRAERLSPGARRALLVMAAAPGLSLHLVRSAAIRFGLSARDVDEAEAAAALVVQGAGAVEFIHPLARAAIYHAGAPVDRRAAHRALAGVMTGRDLEDRRAWHLAAAASGWDAEAATALDGAARRARESSGYAAAANAWSESAGFTDQPDLRAMRFFLAAESAWLGGLTPTALALIDSARTVASEVELKAQIENLSGHIALRQGRVAEGVRMMVEAADSIEPIDRLAAIRILADSAIATMGAGNAQEMYAVARKAYELVRDDDPPKSKMFGRVAYGALSVLVGLGSDGPRHLRDCVELFDEIPRDTADPLVMTCAGFVGLFLRDEGAGSELFARALDGARTHAPTVALPILLSMLAREAAATDRWDVARANYEEGARLARETSQLAVVGWALAGLAWLDALEGRDQECREHAAEALRLSEQHGMGFYKAWSMIGLGQLELGLGRPESALQHLDACDRFLKSISIYDPDLSPQPDIVDALVRLGRLDEARQVAIAYEATAREKGLPFALARAARALGLVADEADFEARYEAALHHHKNTPDLFERARTVLYYGERLRRNRKRVAAREHLREALKAFDRLGAAPWRDRALTELKATGETARSRDERYQAQLTPQELQVGLALAEGRTTREAAARLFLSPKTVEYHLRHVYEKLEIRSREELRAKLLPEPMNPG